MTLERLTQRAKKVILDIPQKPKISVQHLLKEINQALGVGNHLLQKFPKLTFKKTQQVSIEALLKEAYYQSISLDHSYVGTEHLLLAALKLAQSPDLEAVRAELIKSTVFANALRFMERSKKAPYTISFGENLNYRSIKELERPLIYREEYDYLVSILLQKQSANPLIVGDPGVGKTSLIALLAKNISMLEVPTSLLGYQIIEVDLLSLMSNAFNKGNIEHSLLTLVSELRDIGKVILSVKNFQHIFFASNMGLAIPMFYSMFISSLESSGIRMIATMDSSIYDRIVGDNENIFRSFTPLVVKEPQEALILEILSLNADYFKTHYHIDIPSDVVTYIYNKSKVVLKDMRFPRKGLFLLDQSCARLSMLHNRVPTAYKTLVDTTFNLAQTLDREMQYGQYDTALATQNQIKAVEKSLIHLEVGLNKPKKLTLTTVIVDAVLDGFGIEHKDPLFSQDLRLLQNLDKRIKRRIIGQDAAVDVVTKSLIRSKLGLRSKNRPLGNFLFLGPTGVGKTELAKVLAEEVFGENALIRLDMSDFAEKHTVSRLVGAPPGYVGYGEGGELTSKIETTPNSVVLFDEIEKAHPDVLNILLQITEEGQLVDAKGSVFNFQKALIILTSNLGTEILHNGEIGFGNDILPDTSVETRLKTNLKKILKPELLNRMDEVVVFNRLKPLDQSRVLNNLISDVTQTLCDQNITLKILPAARKYLLESGYSVEYGARSLRRIVEKELLDTIAQVLLDIKERPLKLVVSMEKGKLIATVA